VTLVEREGALGGRLRLLDGCGPAAELLESVRFAAEELERLGVEVRLGAAVDAEVLERERPDVVVLATGAIPGSVPVLAGDRSVRVLAVDAALRSDVTGLRVLVLDHLGVEEAAICAERLAADAAHVTLATPMPTVGAFIGFTRISEQLRRLYALGCALETTVQLAGIEDGEALLRHVHARTTRRVPVDVVVAGVAGRPDLSLAEPARAVGARVLVAGDATAPRTAMHAFREGDDAGRAA
jgi:hypothetical protein